MADEKDPNTDDVEENASAEGPPAADTPAEDTPVADTPATDATVTNATVDDIFADNAGSGEGTAEDILAEIPENNQDGFDGDEGSGEGEHTAHDLSAVYDVPVQVSAVLGKATMQVSQLLKLGRGAVVELDRKVGEAIDIYVNNRLVARGEIVVVDERLGVTMTEIVKADN
jgi:flagellar motor switch protein FliN/FliY